MNKEQIVNWIQQGARMVCAHESDPLAALGMMREIASACNDAIKDIDPIALDAADRLGGKEVESGGYRFRRSDGAKKWDFSMVPAIISIKERMKPLEADIKAEEERSVIAARLLMEQPLRYRVENGYAYDKESGECIGYPPELKPTKPSLTLIK